MNPEQIRQLCEQHPIVKELIELKETMWFNPNFTTLAEGLPFVGLSQADIDDARDRLTRFAPYLMAAFPETAATHGMIESELAAIPHMQQQLEAQVSFGNYITCIGVADGYWKSLLELNGVAWVEAGCRKLPLS